MKKVDRPAKLGLVRAKRLKMTLLMQDVVIDAMNVDN